MKILIEFRDANGLPTLKVADPSEIKAYQENGTLIKAGQATSSRIKKWAKEVESARNGGSTTSTTSKGKGSKKTTTTTTTTTTSSTDVTTIPGYNNLNPDEQQAIKKLFDMLVTKGSKVNIDALNNALDNATKEVNPYWAEQLRIAKDAINNVYNQGKQNYTDKYNQLQDRINRIQEDLTTGKNRLTLQEQADLAQQKSNYQQQLDDLQNSMANRGLTFSSNRANKENLLNQRYYNPQYGIIESTKRQYQNKLEDLQREAARGNADALSALQSLKNTFNQNLLNSYRKAEQYLGTANLPSIPGVSPLGNVGGNWARQKEQDIWNYALKSLQLKNPFNY